MDTHAKLDQYFKQWYEIRSVDIWAEKKGIDRIYRNDDRSIAVTYKVGNYVEHVFLPTTVYAGITSTYGWVWTCRSDILIYYNYPDDKVFIANPYDIRDHIPFWSDQFGYHKEGHVEGVLVPFWHFEKIAKVRNLAT